MRQRCVLGFARVSRDDRFSPECVSVSRLSPRRVRGTDKAGERIVWPMTSGDEAGLYGLSQRMSGPPGQLVMKRTVVGHRIDVGERLRSSPDDFFLFWCFFLGRTSLKWVEPIRWEYESPYLIYSACSSSSVAVDDTINPYNMGLIDVTDIIIC